MVRTERVARGLLTYVGRVTGSGSHRVPASVVGSRSPSRPTRERRGLVEAADHGEALLVAAARATRRRAATCGSIGDRLAATDARRAADRLRTRLGPGGCRGPADAGRRPSGRARAGPARGPGRGSSTVTAAGIAGAQGRNQPTGTPTRDDAVARSRHDEDAATPPGRGRRGPAVRPGERRVRRRASAGGHRALRRPPVRGRRRPARRRTAGRTTRRASRSLTTSRRASTRMSSENLSTDRVLATSSWCLSALGMRTTAQTRARATKIRPDSSTGQTLGGAERSLGRRMSGVSQSSPVTPVTTGIHAVVRRGARPTPGEPPQQPARHLLDGDREEPVVAPRPRRCGGTAARSRSPRSPSFSTTRSDAVFSGPDRDLDPVQPQPEEAVVDGQRHRDRHVPAAGVPLVDPVADAGEPRRPADDVAHRHLAGELRRRR